MKTSIVLGSALAALFVTSLSGAATKTYKATLNGTQEVPSVTTTATGTATLTFDDVSKKLYGTVTFTGLTNITGQHIHKGGACGANGSGILKALPGPNGNTITIPQNGGNSITLSTADEAELVAGTLYVNIHTQAHANGEIRGQLYEDGSGKTCPATAADAGADASTSDGGSTSSSSSSSSSGGSSTSSSGGSSTSSSSGASTERADSGTENAAPADDGGCSTTGSRDASGNGLAIALGLGVAVAGVARARKKTKR